MSPPDIPPPAAGPPPADAPATAARILLVDDQQANLVMLAALLEREGYQVHAVNNGRQALHTVHEVAPDIILLDILMPEMDGFAVCQGLKSDPDTRDIPVIFLSALNDVEQKVKALALGGVDYVVKPFRSEEVLARVETHLTSRRLQLEMARQNVQLQREVQERLQAEAALRQSQQQLEQALAELQTAQEQVVQQARLAAVGQLAAGLAHDFNNLAASIILYADIMLSRAALPATEREWIQIIRDQGDKVAHLTQQLLDFGRRALLRLQEVDLVQLWPTLVAELSTGVSPPHRLAAECHPDELPVNLDAARLLQGLNNVVQNAQEAMPQGGHICLALTAVRVSGLEDAPLADMSPGAWACLRISDSGHGLEAAVQDRVFEPFFTTKPPPHSGLGLAQLYGIVKQHGGAVTLRGQPGRGCTVAIYLPVAGPADPGA